MLSAAFQREVVDFISVDLVTEAGFLWTGDVPVFVDRWQVGHPDAQQVLRHHDFGEVAVSDGECQLRYIARLSGGP